MSKSVDYSLRPATLNDFSLSYEIRKNALGEYVAQTWGWDDKWQLDYHKQDFNVNILQIIEVEGKPIGTLESYREDDYTVVSGLYIIDAYQNKNIGCRIMDDLVHQANSKGGAIKLQVLKVNVKAKNFYERLGFDIYDENETHYKMVYNV
ncbi:MAG TPA: GNAT family N-acetyltransferase [Ignavibacteria bacterium]